MQGGLDYKDFAVMYRTNAQSRAMEQAFVNQSTPLCLGGRGGLLQATRGQGHACLLAIDPQPGRSRQLRANCQCARARHRQEVAAGIYVDWVSGTGATISEALNRLFYDDPTPLSTAAEKKFRAFADLLASWQEMAKIGDLVNMFDNITAQTRYYIHLEESSNLPEEAAERADNVRELRGLLEYAMEYEQPLHEFLAEQSLVADVDTLKDGADAVTLMTLHSAKGLEFPVVFITGSGDRHSTAFPRI